MEIAPIKQLIWNGKVPLWIVWKGESCFLLASRISYFPLYDAQFSRYFGRLMAASTFTFEDGSAIPWHLPIGVIFDIYIRGCDSDQPTPFLKLIAPQADTTAEGAVGIDQVASGFYGRLKEADALSSGSSVPKVIPSIASAQQAAIFDTIVTGNLGKHLSNRPSLALQMIPVRLYREAKWKLLAADPQLLLSDLLADLPTDSVAITQGIELPKDVKLFDLYELSYPDGFLYLVIH